MFFICVSILFFCSFVSLFLEVSENALQVYRNELRAMKMHMQKLHNDGVTNQREFVTAIGVRVESLLTEMRAMRAQSSAQHEADTVRSSEHLVTLDGLMEGAVKRGVLNGLEAFGQYSSPSSRVQRFIVRVPDNYYHYSERGNFEEVNEDDDSSYISVDSDDSSKDDTSHRSETTSVICFFSRFEVHKN